MKKEQLTTVEKSTILSLRERAKQLMRELPLKDAIAICNEVIKETSQLFRSWKIRYADYPAGTH